MENKQPFFWTTCPECYGRGRTNRRLRKKKRLKYQRELERFNKNNQEGTPPARPKPNLLTCETCAGSGLLPADAHPKPDTKHYPHVAIIGGGIGGAALAVACLHRGIPFTLYERDISFDARSQGYGLTLQQASRAMQGFGLSTLTAGVNSTRHLVHTPEGEVVGEWGMRNQVKLNPDKPPKRINVHIARQALRLALLEQLPNHNIVAWGHQLVDFRQVDDGTMELNFQVEGKRKTANADLVVGADGIRSTVRRLLIGEEVTPLRYLGVIVILGICPLAALKDIKSDLLDRATVFQTANGNERIYMMPYASDSIMWQLSFPMSEEAAKTLSSQGSEELKKEAIRRTPWHDPIPAILNATKADLISGYPVYDRAILASELLEKSGSVTLLGDAAHPMSPFKGQGANQALLDALLLARGIKEGCKPMSEWREVGMRKKVLIDFELKMLNRTAAKVKDSAAAAKFLHSDIALEKGNSPRGREFRNKGKLG